MPNGEDANLARLATCIADYHARYGDWPTHVRFTPPFLADIAVIIGPHSLERLAELMEVRTERGDWEHGISVGGRYGVVRYDDFPHHLPPEGNEGAWEWLRANGVKPHISQ